MRQTVLSVYQQWCHISLLSLCQEEKEDRPDVIVDGAVNFAFLGQLLITPRDTVFTTEYSVRTAMEAVYGLLGVDRGVPRYGEVFMILENYWIVLLNWWMVNLLLK